MRRVWLCIRRRCVRCDVHRAHAIRYVLRIYCCSGETAKIATRGRRYWRSGLLTRWLRLVHMTASGTGRSHVIATMRSRHMPEMRLVIRHSRGMRDIRRMEFLRRLHLRQLLQTRRRHAVLTVLVVMAMMVMVVLRLSRTNLAALLHLMIRRRRVKRTKYSFVRDTWRAV